MNKETVFSPCRKYRYTLWREWDMDLLSGCADDSPNAGKFVMFIGLNPSTADETKDDPTIRRCIDFAKRWGYGALCMTNLFAWRDTKPTAMKKQTFPEGTNNIHHLLRCGSEAGIVIAAWGNHGKHRNADVNVRDKLNAVGIRLHHLGLNDDGSPKHPLYRPATTKPELFQ